MRGLRLLAGAAALTSIAAYFAADLAPSALHSFLACAVVFVGAVPLLLELSTGTSRSSPIIISSCFVIGFLYGILVRWFLSGRSGGKDLNTTTFGSRIRNGYFPFTF